jgi:hypothetical protein
LCRAIDSIKPAFCPQQNLFKLFKGQSLSLLSPKYFKDYENNARVGVMNDAQRKTYLLHTKKVREDFNETCKNCFENDFSYDDNNNLQEGGTSYTHITRLICKFASQMNPSQEVCDLCNTMFSSDHSMYPNFPFTLNDIGDPKPNEREDSVQDTRREVYIRALVMLIAVVSFMTLIIYFAKSANIGTIYN